MATLGLGREDWVISGLSAERWVGRGWVQGNKKPRPCGAGFCDLALPAYAPDRPAPVGEVISTSTRMAAALAWWAFVAGVWRCNIPANYPRVSGLVKRKA